MPAPADTAAADARPLRPGDVLAIDTAAGTRHVQVTHARAPHPEVLRAIAPAARPDQAAAGIARGPTAFIAMAELGRALARGEAGLRRLGHAPLPAAAQPFPRFRIPIRDRAGEILYWWHWDGDSLSVAPDPRGDDLPIREVLGLEALRRRLAAL
ncbi:MAG: hypothetical protein D6686_09770 [Alphaproteobacteria bacterium]|nr:MAG: hypothetical protein D6686_09770 [Alphaproteobacteria bacterium]